MNNVYCLITAECENSFGYVCGKYIPSEVVSHLVEIYQYPNNSDIIVHKNKHIILQNIKIRTDTGDNNLILYTEIDLIDVLYAKSIQDELCNLVHFVARFSGNIMDKNCREIITYSEGTISYANNLLDAIIKDLPFYNNAHKLRYYINKVEELKILCNNGLSNNLKVPNLKRSSTDCLISDQEMNNENGNLGNINENDIIERVQRKLKI